MLFKYLSSVCVIIGCQMPITLGSDHLTSTSCLMRFWKIQALKKQLLRITVLYRSLGLGGPWFETNFLYASRNFVWFRKIFRSLNVESMWNCRERILVFPSTAAGRVLHGKSATVQASKNNTARSIFASDTICRASVSCIIHTVWPPDRITVDNFAVKLMAKCKECMQGDEDKMAKTIIHACLTSLVFTHILSPHRAKAMVLDHVYIPYLQQLLNSLV